MQAQLDVYSGGADLFAIHLDVM